MFNKAVTSTWRTFLKAQQQQLEIAYFEHQNASKLLKKHCQLVDHILRKIWLDAGIIDQASLVAVGGYGRGELYPHSDIDLLFLLPNYKIEGLDSKLEAIIGLLWDIGLQVGHSVRTLDECLIEYQADITIQTNLLEARLLTGDQSLYEAFKFDSKKLMQPQSYFFAKFKEQENRHAKFNDTAYNLEPNIKESPGGLRDLHMILWLTRSQFLGENWSQLAKAKLISPLELNQIKRHERNLQTLRIRLHYLANRREDRLLFDFQNELADNLRFVTTSRKRASEQLMHSYFKSAKFVNLINEILLKKLENTLSNIKPIIIEINSRFESRDNVLYTKLSNVLQKTPSAILESFLLLQQHQNLTGMSTDLLRELVRVKKCVNKDFRHNRDNKATFLSILSQANGVNHSLRRMNRYGILGEYIPAFGKIVGQMQHDLFHVYTVDEHILNVLANLRRFAKPELKHEFPLCNTLFATFENPRALYLAAIFHDIAKGRGGDHSTLGVVDAKRFCKLHNLPKAETSLVAWLVEVHLKMSSTAQKCDLSDPAVIEQFARFVKTEQRLVALYLLTVADIRGTSPVVWNAWKARLLENLFNLTKRVLQDKAFSVQQALETRLIEATQKLLNYGLDFSAYQPLWDNVGEDYFARYESDEISWHSRLLTPHVFSITPIVRARLSPNGDGIQTMIFAKDQDDLFARICLFFDSMACNIAQATIYTTSHGYALNSFIVLDQSGKSVSYSGLLKFIEINLTKKITESTAIKISNQGRVSRQVKHMAFPTQVNIRAEVSSQMHTVELITADQPGLLAKVAFIFFQLNIVLHIAKINTLGNRAEDSFLISDKYRNKLSLGQIEILTAKLKSNF